MSAPKRFFIGHRLLYVGTIRAEDWPTSGNALCRPTPKFVSVVSDGRGTTPLLVGLSGVGGSLKCRESESGGLLWRVPTVGRQRQSSQSLARIKSGPVVDAQVCRKKHAGASHATTILSSAHGRALEFDASNFRLRAYRNHCEEFARRGVWENTNVSIGSRADRGPAQSSLI